MDDSNRWSEAATREAVSSLRRRLDAFKDTFGEDFVNEAVRDTEEDKRERRAARKREGNCMDTIVDGSFMGMVLALCLVTVLCAAFFAFRNLYNAVVKRAYPEANDEL